MYNIHNLLIILYYCILIIYPSEVMLYVIINYLIISFLFTGILFYLIQHSPTGWEDEQGFHFKTKNNKN
jgi:hypothetical protein